MSTNIIDDSTKLDFIVVIKFPKISKITLRMSYFRHRKSLNFFFLPILVVVVRPLQLYWTYFFLLLCSRYAQNNSDEVRIRNYYPTTLLEEKKNSILTCRQFDVWGMNCEFSPWQIRLSSLVFKVGRIIRLWIIIEGIMTWRERIT